MVKFPEADMRLFKNVFVCKRCSAKIKAQNIKIAQGKLHCRGCGGKSFRPIRKK